MTTSLAVLMRKQEFIAVHNNRLEGQALPEKGAVTDKQK
jgi:hypothetical protein